MAKVVKKAAPKKAVKKAVPKKVVKKAVPKKVVKNAVPKKVVKKSAVSIDRNTGVVDVHCPDRDDFEVVDGLSSNLEC